MKIFRKATRIVSKPGCIALVDENGRELTTHPYDNQILRTWAKEHGYAKPLQIDETPMPKEKNWRC